MYESYEYFNSRPPEIDQKTEFRQEDLYNAIRRAREVRIIGSKVMLRDEQVYYYDRGGTRRNDGPEPPAELLPNPSVDSDSGIALEPLLT